MPEHTQIGLKMYEYKLFGNDPRSVSREISGIFETILPQLVPVTVAHLNRFSYKVPNCVSVPIELVKKSTLQRSMLFELAVVTSKEKLKKANIDVNWDECLSKAIKEQRKYYDAQIPFKLAEIDKEIALKVSDNLLLILDSLKVSTIGKPNDIQWDPKIPGYRWIANGEGDFSIGDTIIEVKCTNKHFSSADYRQIVMYWLLSYISSIERETIEWTNGILVNPRLNYINKFSFNEILKLISADRSKIDLVEAFKALVLERRTSEQDF